MGCLLQVEKHEKMSDYEKERIISIQKGATITVGASVLLNPSKKNIELLETNFSFLLKLHNQLEEEKTTKVFDPEENENTNESDPFGLKQLPDDVLDELSEIAPVNETEEILELVKESVDLSKKELANFSETKLYSSASDSSPDETETIETSMSLDGEIQKFDENSNGENYEAFTEEALLQKLKALDQVKEEPTKEVEEDDDSGLSFEVSEKPVEPQLNEYLTPEYLKSVEKTVSGDEKEEFFDKELIKDLKSVKEVPSADIKILDLAVEDEEEEKIVSDPIIEADIKAGEGLTNEGFQVEIKEKEKEEKITEYDPYDVTKGGTLISKPKSIIEKWEDGDEIE